MNDKKLNPIAGATICLIISIPILVFGYFFTKHAKESVSWPTVKGTIVRSEFTRKNGEDSYLVHIEYEYNLANQIHRGKRMTYKSDNSSRGSGSARFEVDRYPVGKSVEVYYDPRKSSRCVLRPGADKVNGFMILGLGFFLWGAGSIVVVVVKRNKNSN
jgi:hypothetical protein